MPLKPIIDIDVNDDRFKEFLDLFANYKRAVDSLPEGWSKIGEATAKSGVGLGDMAALLGAQAEMLHRLTHEHQELERSASGYGRIMQGAAHEVGNIARGIADTTRNLLRWTGITGLLGVGGLFGLDRLMGNASSLRTRAMGLGASPATVLAANTNFGQFLNAQGALSNIANLQQNLSGQIAFNTLGIPGSWNADPGSALTSMLGAVHSLYRQTPAGERQNMPWYQQASQVLGPEEIRTIGNMSDTEFRRHIADYQRDRTGNFGLQPGTLQAAQDVDRQLTRVGYTLEYTFLASLNRVMPELEALSQALGGSVAAFLNGPGFAHLVDVAAAGLDKLSQWISSPDFETDTKKFATDLGVIVAGFGNLAQFMIDHPGVFGAVAGAVVGGNIAGLPGAAIGSVIGGSIGAGSPGGTNGGIPNYEMPGGGYRAPAGNSGYHWWNPFSWSHSGASGAAGSPAIDSAYAASGIAPEGQAFMRDIASGEATRFNELAGGGSFNDYSGFPNWAGVPSSIPGKLSHGAGMFQDETGTWGKIAAGAGLSDFSPTSQIRGNWWWAQKTYHDASGHDLLTDLRSGKLDPAGRAALGTQWARGGIAGGSRYAHTLEAMGQTESQYATWAAQWHSANNVSARAEIDASKPRENDFNRDAWFGAAKRLFDKRTAPGPQSQVKISIDNQTGGSAVVSASQMQTAY